MLAAIGISINMESISSKALPLLFATVIVILSVLQLGKELVDQKQKPIGANNVSQETTKGAGEQRRYALVVGW